MIHVKYEVNVLEEGLTLISVKMEEGGHAGLQ